MPDQRPLNGFAVAALITGLLGIVVLGIVFGFIALNQIKQTGEEGHGLAVAGIAVSFAYLGMFVLVMLGVLLFTGLFTANLLT